MNVCANVKAIGSYLVTCTRAIRTKNTLELHVLVNGLDHSTYRIKNIKKLVCAALWV